MEPVVVVTAVMADGTAISDIAHGFSAFVDLVLGFRRDADVRRLTWAELPDPPPALLARAIARAAARPGFLAHTLRGQAPADLAARLGIDAASVGRLLLCRAPAPRRREADLQEIAEYAAVDAGRLAVLLGPSGPAPAR